MDYAKYFKKNGWASMGRYYMMHPTKLQQLLKKAKKYASREGLNAVKEEFLISCSYIRDVFTGKYKGYNVLNLTVIIGAIVYVVTPIDAIPDFVPAGLIDDTAILLWASKEFAEELERYKSFFKSKTGAMPFTSEDIEEVDFEEIPESQKALTS